MTKKERIGSLINTITANYLELGVQPSELVENAFNSECEKVETYRKQERLFVDIVYSDIDDENKTYKYTMRYIYTKDRSLTRIDQKMGKNQFKKQWCRQEILDLLIDELRILLLSVKDKSFVDKVVKSIPLEIQKSITNHLKLVA
ncbi:MAG: hypothetical protein C0621_10355 [Desulfuromonas sp.]|nr:MAG: hypothetical protein C0621_10355 [Desulfuromonas sp.]